RAPCRDPLRPRAGEDDPTHRRPAAPRLRGRAQSGSRPRAPLQQSRTRNTEGRIVATLEDYGVVRQLVHDVVADGVEAAVSKTIRETVEAVASLHAVSDSDVAVVAVARMLGLDKSAAWRRVQAALAKWYLKKLEDRRYRPARPVAGEGLPDDEEVLPTVEALETKLKEEGCRVAGDSRGTDTPPSSSEAA